MGSELGAPLVILWERAEGAVPHRQRIRVSVLLRGTQLTKLITSRARTQTQDWVIAAEFSFSRWPTPMTLGGPESFTWWQHWTLFYSKAACHGNCVIWGGLCTKRRSRNHRVTVLERSEDECVCVCVCVRLCIVWIPKADGSEMSMSSLTHKYTAHKCIQRT